MGYDREDFRNAVYMRCTGKKAEEQIQGLITLIAEEFQTLHTRLDQLSSQVHRLSTRGDAA